jgi:hypothetical protein
MAVFNRCAETGNVLLMTECWQDVHPGLVSVPVDWDYRIPYGLLYSADAPEDVRRFVAAVKKQTQCIAAAPIESKDFRALKKS